MATHRFRLYGPGSSPEPIEVAFDADDLDRQHWLDQLSEHMRRQQIVELTTAYGGEVVVNMSLVWAIEFRPPPPAPSQSG